MNRRNRIRSFSAIKEELKRIKSRPNIFSASYSSFKRYEEVIIVCRIGYCPICKQEGMILTKHHKWKRSVWGRNRKKNGKVIWLCRFCHGLLEAEITRRENALLQKNPHIYIGTLDEFLKGRMTLEGSDNTG